jgi:hypothetical protein
MTAHEILNIKVGNLISDDRALYQVHSINSDESVEVVCLDSVEKDLIGRIYRASHTALLRIGVELEGLLPAVDITSSVEPACSPWCKKLPVGLHDSSCEYKKWNDKKFKHLKW